MLKRIGLVALVVLAFAGEASSAEIIGGVTGGYTYNGPASGAPWFSATTGARLGTFNEGWTKIYTVARLAGTEDDGLWGAKAILAQKISSNGVFWWVLDAGALDGGCINSDGSDEITPSFGTGPAVALNKYMSVALYGEAWRTSGDTWGMAASLAIQAHLYTGE